MTSVPAKIVPFFILNDELEEATLRRAVCESANAGVDGLFLHPRPGLLTPYLSERWFEAISICIEACRAEGITSWLYDEYPYPSGAAGGFVVAADANHAARHLEIIRRPLTGPGRRNILIGPHPIVQAFLVPCGRESEAKVVTDQVGILQTAWKVRDWDSRHYYPSRHAKVYACPRSTAEVPEWVFCGDVPKGNWELVAFQLVTGDVFREPFGDYIDVTNRAATETFLALTHEAYRSRFGKDFGGQIPGIFTDEPKLAHELLWSEALASAWPDYQVDPRALLSLLPESRASSSLRKKYRDAAMNLFTHQWVRPVSDWCSEHHLQLCGHISPEENWWVESRLVGSVLKQIRLFAVPGCDLIIPAVGDADHPVLNLMPSLCASAAAQSGSEYALCELFAVSNYDLNLQGMKRIADWLAAFGINFFVPHSFFLSLNGYRKFDAPPTVIAPSTLAPFLSDWCDHVRAMAGKLGPRNLRVDVAIVRPISRIRQLSDSEKPLAESWYDAGIQLAQDLLRRGIAFHWLDDDDLPDLHVLEGKAVFAQASYQILILAEGVDADEVSSELEPLRQAGVVVIGAVDAAKLPGSLRSDGEIRASQTLSGGWFCVNLAPTLQPFQLEGVTHQLEGYESRFLPGNPAPSRSQNADHVISLEDRMEAQPESDNTYVLPHWEVNGTERTLGPIYEMTGISGSKIETVFGPVPAAPRLESPVEVRYRTKIRSRGALTISLCYDAAALKGHWQILMNQEPLTQWQEINAEGHTYCCHDLNGLLDEGENELIFLLTAHDAYDGMSEPPWLRGHFEVIEESGTILLISPQNRLRTGNWAEAGYPHYSGSVRYEGTVFLETDPVGRDVVLRFIRPPADMAKVEINGQPIGNVLWSPWTCDVSKCLREGPNHIAITVTNTLTNFIYGQARPSGILGPVHLEFWSGDQTGRLSSLADCREGASI